MNLEEARTVNFWRAVFTEWFGTTIFIYIVTSVLINLGGGDGTGASIVNISLVIGLAISVLAQIFGPISGGHFNPAVTFAVLVKGEITIIKAILYTAAQIVGGITGAAFTYVLTPDNRRGALGNLPLAEELTQVQGFFVEMLMTMLLVFTVLASTSSDNGRKDFGYSNGLAIGISIVVSHLVAIPYTGSGINPARAFGPAAVLGKFQDYHWIYWIGPYVGAIIASLLYRFLFGVELENKESLVISNNKNSSDEKQEPTQKQEITLSDISP